MSTASDRVAEYVREIEEIRRSGGDLTRPHYVAHSLIFTRGEDAERARQRLAAYEFDDVSIMDDSIDGSWTVSAGREQVLNARHLEQTRSAMERVAAEFGGQYEDWQVGVHIDGWPDCGCEWPDGQQCSP